MKFGVNQPCGIGGDVVYSKYLTNDGHHRVKIAHLELKSSVIAGLMHK